MAASEVTIREAPCGWVFHRFKNEGELRRAHNAVNEWLERADRVTEFLNATDRILIDHPDMPKRLAAITVWTANVSFNWQPV